MASLEGRRGRVGVCRGVGGWLGGCGGYGCGDREDCEGAFVSTFWMDIWWGVIMAVYGGCLLTGGLLF